MNTNLEVKLLNVISKESKTTLLVPSIHQITVQSLSHRVFMDSKKKS